MNQKEPLLSHHQTELLELLETSGPKLMALLTRLTLREDVAEELMQDLFLKLSGNRNLTEVDCLYAYARRAAINLAFSWRRREALRRSRSLDEIPERASDNHAPLSRLVQSEEMEQILAVIGRLGGTSREAFVMRYIQQDSYEAIAEQLDKTPHQVRALCFRAMKHLRATLGCSDSPTAGKGAQRVEHE
ncbi:MAG: sigma-70 family RNA polymerase sigma factor [Phycisphaerales bacterium]|nr:MAG: sigma-70 family RNA polymerase sigma factor [Phycisphaerales bacterium]